jgi:hypothetical protein
MQYVKLLHKVSFILNNFRYGRYLRNRKEKCLHMVGNLKDDLDVDRRMILQWIFGK